MSNTLKTIQVLSKIGKIISKIVFICCIVGVVGCLIGIASLALGLTGAFKIGGITLHGVIEESAGMSVNSLYTVMVVGAILAACEGVIAKFAEVYFKHELVAGTPFTFAGAKEMLRLGIITAAVSLGGTMIASIVQEVMSHALTDVQELHLEDGTSVGIGLMFIVMSVLCKYGAEQAEKNKDIADV